MRPFIAPAALITGGMLSFPIKEQVRDWRNEHHPNFHTHADNYLQYAPIAAVYGLNVLGVMGKNDVGNATVLLIKTEILTTAVVQGLKYATHEVRPDGSDDHSFPSGHTAQAFAAATFLHKEYGDRSVWYSIGGYAVATSVGAMRILNNRHWLPDVLTGAGIGILSTNIVYMTHKYHGSKKKSQALLTPTYNGGPGFYFLMKIG